MKQCKKIVKQPKRLKMLCSKPNCVYRVGYYANFPSFKFRNTIIVITLDLTVKMKSTINYLLEFDSVALCDETGIGIKEKKLGSPRK